MISRTAAYVALYRALETQTKQPLFVDPLAAGFLPAHLRLLARAARLRSVAAVLERYADARAPGARTSAIARTRFIDDAVSRLAAEQLVILGAGFDCRAHRLPSLAHARVFEVDRRATQDEKRRRLASRGVRADVRYVPVDFLVDDVRARLVEAGWDEAARTTFVWEGVSNYLSEPAVQQVLGLAGGAAAGSGIVFTYIHRGVLDQPADFVGGPRIVANVNMDGGNLLGRVRTLNVLGDTKSSLGPQLSSMLKTATSPINKTDPGGTSLMRNSFSLSGARSLLGPAAGCEF